MALCDIDFTEVSDIPIFKLVKFAYCKALFLVVFGYLLTSQNRKWRLMVKGPIEC